MACDLGFGRIEPCKDSVGGLKAVYFVNYGDATGYTYDATNTDVIDAVAGTPSAYKYDLKGASTFTQNVNSSRENGTTFFEQVLELTFKKLSIKDHKELKLMAYGRPQVIVEDNNGNFFYAGLEHGMDVTGGTIVTGGAMGDLSGYTLTLTGMEKVPANFLGDTLSAVGFTVVSGT
jgi:hypothetical protein